MLEDWRFKKSPYVEYGGIHAYAGAPLRLQNESGETACLGSICVASPSAKEPLRKAQQTTLVRLADWVVADIVQLTRARRQRERRRMVELLAAAQEAANQKVSEEPVFQIIREMYPEAVVGLHSTKDDHIEIDGRLLSTADLSNGLWEDFDYIDDFISKANHNALPDDRVVRIICAPCESVSGLSTLAVGSKDFCRIFDDIDAWFIQSCAGIISQMWQKRLLAEVMIAKEKFLRGFSHQLRTPIHGILGSVELLAEEMKSMSLPETASHTMALLQASSEVDSSQAPKDYLNTIKRAGRDLISIINSMITLNRWADVAITERQYASHPLQELETELANEISKVISGDTRYNASVIFNHNLPADSSSIRTDLGLMRDSLLPLVINAIQSTTEGVVTISFTMKSKSKQLIIDVEDTGRGIPAADQQRIFELYEQVDDYSTGAGLGLTLSSKFAALLQGSVDLVCSDLGRGSHFRATFEGVESTTLEPSSPTLSSKCANLPKVFRHISPHAKPSTLSSYFAKFLVCHGFAPSEDEKEDAFVICDDASDTDEHRGALSNLPLNQVGICLVATPEGDHREARNTKNVIYIQGPFLTATMTKALLQADELSSAMKSGSAANAQISDDNASELHATNIKTTTNMVARNDATSAVEGTEKCMDMNDLDWAARKDSALAHSGSTTEEEELLRIEASAPSPTARPLTGDGPLPACRLEDQKTHLITNEPSTPGIESKDVPLAPLESHQTTTIFPSLATVTHPTALLVDDNSLNLRVMQMYCNKRKLPYVCAKDGNEAVSVFRRHQESALTTGAPIQLILMDLQMPVCDGVEATRQIRQIEEENSWDKSVLFIVTGQDSVADRRAAEAVGSQEYHVKPVSIKSLDGSLKKYFTAFSVGGGG